jgi:hypothetical protein
MGITGLEISTELHETALLIEYSFNHAPRVATELNNDL